MGPPEAWLANLIVVSLCSLRLSVLLVLSAPGLLGLNISSAAFTASKIYKKKSRLIINKPEQAIEFHKKAVFLKKLLFEYEHKIHIKSRMQKSTCWKNRRTIKRFVKKCGFVQHMRTKLSSCICIEGLNFAIK